MTDQPTNYGLSEVGEEHLIPAPALDYVPRLDARDKRIALVGCGGISEYHLRAYRDLGLNVVALCNTTLSKAEARREEFYPNARVTTDYREALTDDVDVLDITTHADVRADIIEAALHAGKHVLSQKPFVNDLRNGERLVQIAADNNVHLAVNQNGRWAPHFAYALATIRAGLLGEIGSLTFALEWDHSWTAGKHFDNMRHLILYDFGIHWFDMCCAIFDGQEPTQVTATTHHIPGQKNKAPMGAHVLVEFPRGQTTMSFNGAVAHGQRDATTITGSLGTLRSEGPSLSDQTLTLYTADGVARPQLQGTWFTNGFQGTMVELLNAIAQHRPPRNNARDNLNSLALCFAALHSADKNGAPVRPYDITRAP